MAGLWIPASEATIYISEESIFGRVRLDELFIALDVGFRCQVLLTRIVVLPERGVSTSL